MEIMNINDVKKYFDGSYATYKSESCGQFWHGGKLDINLSSEYSQLIREAARCNRYASDVIYDIESMNHQLETFNLETGLPIVALGFRKDGVDGNSFILSKLNNDHHGKISGVYREYFSIYFMEIVRDKDYSDYFRVETVGYHV